METIEQDIPADVAGKIAYPLLPNQDELLARLLAAKIKAKLSAQKVQAKRHFLFRREG